MVGNPLTKVFFSIPDFCNWLDLEYILRQVRHAEQDGTSRGESSKPDLILNFILKVRSHCRLWTVDGGLWTVDCGLWTVDCGLWTED